MRKADVYCMKILVYVMRDKEGEKNGLSKPVLKSSGTMPGTLSFDVCASAYNWIQTGKGKKDLIYRTKPWLDYEGDFHKTVAVVILGGMR